MISPWVYQTLRGIALVNRDLAALRKRHVRKRSVRRKKVFRRELDKLVRRKCTMSKALTMHIDDLLSQECFELCDTMQQLLPREVRDMIYIYLFNQETFYADGLEKRKWNNTLEPDTSFRWISQLRSHGLLHLCDRRYVGDETLSEVADAYYRYSTFVLSLNDEDSIPKFLVHYEDYWGFNLNVAQLIESIRIDIGSVYRSYESITLQYDRDQLEALFTLKRPIRIMIHFWYPCKFLRVRFRPQVMDRMFSQLDRLVKAHHKVRIGVGYGTWAFDFEVKSEELTADCWTRKFNDGYNSAHLSHYKPRKMGPNIPYGSA